MEFSGFEQSDDHPVVCVNWQDASAYVGWLSRETGSVYRLPIPPDTTRWSRAAAGPGKTAAGAVGEVEPCRRYRPAE